MDQKELRRLAITDPERAYEILQELKKNNGRTGEVCICGHATTTHSQVGDTLICAPGRIPCLCTEVRVVLKSSNLRVFMKRTRGPATAHALGQGLMAAKKLHHSEYPELDDPKKYVKINWVVPQVCDMCGSNEAVTANALNKRSARIEDESTGIDKLLCFACQVKFGGVEGLE